MLRRRASPTLRELARMLVHPSQPPHRWGTGFIEYLYILLPDESHAVGINASVLTARLIELHVPVGSVVGALPDDRTWWERDSP